jgi:hypothetical protein
MRRQQKHVAFADRHVIEMAAAHHLEHHVALEPVEEFFHRIVVIVGALVGPADDLDRHVGVLKTPADCRPEA